MKYCKWIKQESQLAGSWDQLDVLQVHAPKYRLKLTKSEAKSIQRQGGGLEHRMWPHCLQKTQLFKQVKDMYICPLILLKVVSCLVVSVQYFLLLYGKVASRLIQTFWLVLSWLGFCHGSLHAAAAPAVQAAVKTELSLPNDTIIAFFSKKN